MNEPTSPKASVRTVVRDYGNYYIIANEYLGEETKEITSGVYTASVAPDGESIKLTRMHKRFVTPKRVYGQTLSRVAVIRDDYLNNNHKSLGVMYTGKSGGGKTTEANLLCNDIIAKIPNIIVFYITEKISQKLLLTLTNFGRCIFYFNEFDKYYKKSDQEEMLTFFSDFDLKKAMCIITANLESELSPFILDRPERFKYRVVFQALNEHNIFTFFGTDVSISDFQRWMIAEWAKEKHPSVDNALTLKALLAELGGSSVRYKTLYNRVDLLNVPKLLVPRVYLKYFRYEPAPNGIPANNLDIVLKSIDLDVWELAAVEHSTQREIGFFEINIYDLLEKTLPVGNHSPLKRLTVHSDRAFMAFEFMVKQSVSSTVNDVVQINEVDVPHAFTIECSWQTVDKDGVSELKFNSDWIESRRLRLNL